MMNYTTTGAPVITPTVAGQPSDYARAFPNNPYATMDAQPTLPALYNKKGAPIKGISLDVLARSFPDQVEQTFKHVQQVILATPDTPVEEQRFFLAKKYYGKLCKDIVEQDPNYTVWALNNMAQLRVGGSHPEIREALLHFIAIEKAKHAQ